MSKIKVECEVDAALDDDWKKAEPLFVRSHWNRAAVVEIEVCGKKVFVVAADLEKALRNCTNA